MTSDVLILGAGVVGLSIARELHKSGARSVTIVESGTAARGASHAAAGMLAPNAETAEADDMYRLCAESGRMYPEFADALFEETGVDIELDTAGTLFAAFTESDSAEVRARLKAKRDAGLNVVHLSDAETRKAEPFISPDVRESLYFPDDWQVENRKLLKALLKYAELNGITIVENTAARALRVENGRVTGADAFSAGTTVIATGAWTSLIKPVDIKVRPVKGQMIAFHTAKRLFRRVIYSPSGYLVPRADGRILAGATVEDAGFDAAPTVEGAQLLTAAAAEIALSLANLEIDESWAGLRPASADGLPVLGPSSDLPGACFATGHYRNGILLAPLTARIIADAVAGVNSDWIRAFGPDRFAADRAAGPAGA